MLNKLFRLWLAPLLVLTLTSPLLAQHTAKNPPSATQTATTPATPEGLKPILDYISNGWDTLTRSMNDCSTIVDTKLPTKSFLYLPAYFTITPDLHPPQSLSQ